MTLHGMFEDVTSARNAHVPHLVLKETKDGFEVRTVSPIADRAILIERLSAITGLALIAGALTGILAGKAHSFLGSGSGDMATGAIVLTGGVAYLWIAIRGMRNQVAFDLERRVMNLVACNQTGGVRVLKTFGFDEIKSAFVKRPTGPGKPARLFLRLGDDERLMEIARGPETELRELHTRLGRDLGEKLKPSDLRVRRLHSRATTLAPAA